MSNKKPRNTTGTVKKNRKKIKFIKSPVAVFQLGYGIGQIAEIDGKLADELIKSGYAKGL